MFTESSSIVLSSVKVATVASGQLSPFDIDKEKLKNKQITTISMENKKTGNGFKIFALKKSVLYCTARKNVRNHKINPQKNNCNTIMFVI